ncbi:unnamed protein product [Rotaria sordida]|uniref:Peptidase S1 domain-containing protein n=1 Tax=Rotaria sordida TaxID=392033 RepID=A0A813YXY3_9BILA|nr:unnamed protein product [Rotaria sordida]CAF0890551.1 unnamed protein product [Rotaria sordida]
MADNVVAVGWGRTSENGFVSSTLQQVTLQVVDHQSTTCRPIVTDWTKQFCAGVDGGGKDTCVGDSGGPLMAFTTSNQWILVGVTSNSFGCAQPIYAGGYTRVAAYHSWITSMTNTSFSTAISSRLISKWTTLCSSEATVLRSANLAFESSNSQGLTTMDILASSNIEG